MRGLLLSLVRTACPLDVLMGISSAKGALQAQKQLCNTERTMNHLTMNVRTSALVGHQASAFVGQARTVAAPLKAGLARQRRCLAAATQALAVGDKLPGDVKLNYFDKENNMQEISVDDLTKGKKVVFLAVPGAFTPTCSLKHLPGFVEKADEIKAAGVDTIACVSVNDAFVMSAWAKDVNVGDKILMLADGSAVFTKAVGAELDLADKGLGVRSRRYAMMTDDGMVKELNMEEGGAFTVSSAEEILAGLSKSK